MILNKPLPQVFYDDQNGINEFFLHCVTYFDSTDYEYDAFEPLPNVIDPDGFYRINLKVKESQLPSFTLITPVTHTISLGTLDLNNLSIEVTLSHNGQIVGQGIVRDIDIKKRTRPGAQSNENWL